MPTAILDAKEGISIDPDDYSNECGTLRTLHTGLIGLAKNIKYREDTWKQKTEGKIKTASYYGIDIDGTKEYLDTIACFFHWFGVSVCNYVRLVGFIKGLHFNQFTRTDLSDPKKFDYIKKTVDNYVESVSEISAVLEWRNKVAAHFAITAPHKKDNISTLDMSVIFPVSFEEDRYRVNALTLTRKNSTGTHTSAIPHWSVTEVFENLIPRYWPNIQIVSQSKPE